LVLVVLELLQQSVAILVRVRLETTLFFQLSPQTVVAVVELTLRQATVVQVAVVVVSQGSLQVELVTPLQLHQHKDLTVAQVQLIAPPIVLVAVAVVLQLLAGTVVPLLVAQAVMVAQVQPHQ
jgi:hypothetical protein